jgi:hypothetical protein
MDRKKSELLIGVLGFFLASCATLPEIAQKLDAKTPCCNSVSEFNYEQLITGSPTALLLGEESPVFTFNTGKSYFKAFSIPTQAQGRKLHVRSKPTGSVALETEKWSQVYCPQVTFLDQSFTAVSSSHRVPRYVRGMWSAGFMSDFDIPVSAHYVVFHTNRETDGLFVTRYTSGGAYMVGAAIVADRGGEPIEHPCGPVADAEVEIQ